MEFIALLREAIAQLPQGKPKERRVRWILALNLHGHKEREIVDILRLCNAELRHELDIGPDFSKSTVSRDLKEAYAFAKVYLASRCYKSRPADAEKDFSTEDILKGFEKELSGALAAAKEV